MVILVHTAGTEAKLWRNPYFFQSSQRETVGFLAELGLPLSGFIGTGFLAAFCNNLIKPATVFFPSNASPGTDTPMLRYHVTLRPPTIPISRLASGCRYPWHFNPPPSPHPPRSVYLSPSPLNCLSPCFRSARRSRGRIFFLWVNRR